MVKYGTRNRGEGRYGDSGVHTTHWNGIPGETAGNSFLYMRKNPKTGKPYYGGVYDRGEYSRYPIHYGEDGLAQHMPKLSNRKVPVETVTVNKKTRYSDGTYSRNRHKEGARNPISKNTIREVRKQQMRKLKGDMGDFWGDTPQANIERRKSGHLQAHSEIPETALKRKQKVNKVEKPVRKVVKKPVRKCK
jgi:hypothetical protein